MGAKGRWTIEEGSAFVPRSRHYGAAERETGTHPAFDHVENHRGGALQDEPKMRREPARVIGYRFLGIGLRRAAGEAAIVWILELGNWDFRAGRGAVEAWF
jgi:hypothetical protein